jgi:hypothetical protein
MEWDPNQREILLHNLGRMWFDLHYRRDELFDFIIEREDQGEEDREGTSVLALRATASVRDAFTGREGDQTVWVYVTDQTEKPVVGAQVRLVGAVLPDGALQMPPTDKQGHTVATFEFVNLTPGQLVIFDARVTYLGAGTQTRAFFFPWW